MKHKRDSWSLFRQVVMPICVCGELEKQSIVMAPFFISGALLRYKKNLRLNNLKRIQSNLWLFSNLERLWQCFFGGCFPDGCAFDAIEGRENLATDVKEEEDQGLSVLHGSVYNEENWKSKLSFFLCWTYQYINLAIFHENLQLKTYKGYSSFLGHYYYHFL